MADPVRVWLIGGSSEVNPDDLARAIREGVDARLWALATVAETLGENGAKIASVLGHFFDAATSREPAPPEITALERWYNEGRKARIDGTPCPYQARTLATFMHSKGWLAEDLRQSLAHADPVYGEDQRRSDSPYPILASREPAQERQAQGEDTLTRQLRGRAVDRIDGYNDADRRLDARVADALDRLTAERDAARALADERFAEIKRAQSIIDELKAFREQALTAAPDRATALAMDLQARLAAAESRAAMLEREAARAVSTVVWKDGYCPYCTTLPEQHHTHTPSCSIGALAALAASPSPLAAAIEGVVDHPALKHVAPPCDLSGRALVAEIQRLLTSLDEAVTALRTAWRGAEPGETQT